MYSWGGVMLSFEEAICQIESAGEDVMSECLYVIVWVSGVFVSGLTVVNCPICVCTYM